MIDYSPEPEFVYGSPIGTFAKVICDSISEATGDRVTTFEVQYHRFVHCEFMTHGVFARNSASSRAIPVAKQLQMIRAHPAWPLNFNAEKPGMQSGDALEGDDLTEAWALVEELYGNTVELIEDYIAGHSPEHRLHKSTVNRYLEPFMWHNVVVTATSFQNFFDLRVHPKAQKEIQEVAELMQAAYIDSEPEALVRGQWHTPYIRPREDLVGFDKREISSARTARLSYRTQDGARDPREDVRLYGNLTSDIPMHSSPLEHICTPDKWNQIQARIVDPDTDESLGFRRLPIMGKFLGWQQWRHIVEGRKGAVSYR